MIDEDAVKKYLLERKEIYDAISEAIATNITNFEQLKQKIPKLQDICNLLYGEKEIPAELDMKKVFRFFRMIWKDDSYFRKVENKLPEDKDA